MHCHEQSLQTASLSRHAEMVLSAAQQQHVHPAGEQYEARLRLQHTKLNPRTAWAKRRAGGSAEDAEGNLTAGGALARPSRLPKGTIEACIAQ